MLTHLAATLPEDRLQLRNVQNNPRRVECFFFLPSILVVPQPEVLFNMSGFQKKKKKIKMHQIIT